MKKILSLIVICLVAVLPIQNSQATKTIIKKDPIGINIYNSTGVNCSISVSGPTSFSQTLYPGVNNMGPITPGNYTVTLYGPSDGLSHNYVFYFQSKSSSTGSATFTANIQYNAFGSIQ